MTLIIIGFFLGVAITIYLGGWYKEFTKKM